MGFLEESIAPHQLGRSALENIAAHYVATSYKGPYDMSDQEILLDLDLLVNKMLLSN